MGLQADPFFYCTLLYWVSQTLGCSFFLNKSKQPSCIEAVYLHHSSNSICSLWVSVSYCVILTIFQTLFHYYLLERCIVRGLWCPYCNCFEMPRTHKEMENLISGSTRATPCLLPYSLRHNSIEIRPLINLQWPLSVQVKESIAHFSL